LKNGNDLQSHAMSNVKFYYSPQHSQICPCYLTYITLNDVDSVRSG